MDYAETKQKAHTMIDLLEPAQVAAAVGVLEAMLDPFERAVTNAPFDDEPMSEEEERELAVASASIARGEGTSHEGILAEYGLTSEDWKRMGTTPLEARVAAK